MLLTLSIIALVFASLSAILFFRNLRLYEPPPPPALRSERVSIIIPARNEERTIAAAIKAALANPSVTFEIIIANDHSDDRTADIVSTFSAFDNRVRLIDVPALPPGWNGKQHACWIGANNARYETLCFADADLRFNTDALATLLAELERRKAKLISGVPLEETRSWSERMMIPLISFVLLGYLPLDKVRATNDPAFAAGIGQLFLCDRDAYFASGGHRAIRQTLHDGLRLPRLFREKGFHTDLFDGTSVATCRMYESFSQVWSGLLKNAIEGMAAPRLIGIFTLLLCCGHVLPLLVLITSLATHHPTATVISMMATAVSYAPRFAAIHRFGDSILGAITHPIAITLLLIIQWYALLRHLRGRKSEWKGRLCGVDLNTSDFDAH